MSHGCNATKSPPKGNLSVRKTLRRSTVPLLKTTLTRVTLESLAPKRQPSRPQNSGFCRITQSVTPISPTKSASSWMLLPNTECLNDQLHIGPDLLNSLVSVLLRFRERRVGLAADIEAMFHQVQIMEENQPALRFLWWNLELQRPPDVYQMLVMIFGATSSPCMANYVLRKTALDNREDILFSEDTIQSVEKNFFMDNFLKSVCDEATAVRMFREMTSLLSRGGFRLTKWISSLHEVLSQIPLKEKASPLVDVNFDELPIECTLGLKWNTKTDCFRFSLCSSQTGESTKRGVLSRLSTVFDPLGVLAPDMLPAKCLIQMLWRKNKGALRCALR